MAALESLVSRKTLAGALSGALLVFCFPRPSLHLLAWVALVPVLWIVSEGRPRTAAKAGAAAGLFFHTGNLHWISQVMVEYGGLGRGMSLVVLFVLIGYLSAFFCAFAGLAAAACKRWGARSLFLAPLFWVGFEIFRNYPFGGFPWCLLGYSQVSALPVYQIASITGVYGVSFLLVLVNATWVYVLRTSGLKPRLRAAVPVAALVAAVLAFGWKELGRSLPRPGLRVAAVQGNVHQEEKWKPELASEIFSRHMALSASAAAQGARLVVWPESSTPFNFDRTPALANAMRAFARQTQVYLFFGSDDYEYPDPRKPDDYRVYNGAKLLDPEGELTFRYHKMHLVPFGEYVPLSKVFFFAKNLTQEVGGFSPGTEVKVGRLDGGSIGAFICYEAIYPDLIRRFAVEGGGLFVQLTNDAWFGTSWAPYQHFSMAVARAVENRRYLLRAANTGISAVVDPYGRITVRKELLEQGVLVADVDFRTELTPYARRGDLLAWLGAVVTLAFGASVLSSRFAAKRSPQPNASGVGPRRSWRRRP